MGRRGYLASADVRFPDGQGYMNIAWNGLTRAQRLGLLAAWRVGATGDPEGIGGIPTCRVLRSYGLITDDRRITQRGIDLVTWVMRSGHLS